MKKIVFSVIVAISVLAFDSKSFAQTVGTQYLQGIVGGSFSTSSDTKSWSVALCPEYGKFVAKNLSVGAFVQLEYGHGKMSFFGSDNKTNSFYALLGGTTRYHVRIAKWFYYTPDLMLGVMPFVCVDGSVAKAVAFWGQLDAISFDFRFSKTFALNLGLLSYQAMTSTNVNQIGNSSGLYLNPCLSAKFFF